MATVFSVKNLEFKSIGFEHCNVVQTIKAQKKIIPLQINPWIKGTAQKLGSFDRFLLKEV
jgi:hypothetical protein